MNVLFVCTGNICRSAMAELFFREKVRAAGRTDEVKSAGVAAFPGSPVPDEVLRLAARAGLSAKPHRARLLSRELLEWADLVLVMDGSHKRTLQTHFAGAAGKTHLLKEFVGARGGKEIADPIGQSQEVYEACAAEIQDALEKLLDKTKGADNVGA